MRSRVIIGTAFLGTLSLILSSCATLPPRRPTGLRAETFWKEQAHRSELFRRVSAKVGLRLEGKEHNISGRGRLVAQAPGELRLELRDPLGRVQYVVAMQKGSLVAYYPREKLAYVESQSGKQYVKRFMGLDFAFEELEDVFLGVIPARFRKSAFDAWEWDGEKGAYRGTLRERSGAGERKVNAYVDPDTAALRALEVDSAAERVRVTYEDFNACCGKTDPTRLAQLVKVELVNPPSVVELQWREIERLDRPREASVFRLELPMDVRRVGLE